MYQTHYVLPKMVLHSSGTGDVPTFDRPWSPRPSLPSAPAGLTMPAPTLHTAAKPRLTNTKFQQPTPPPPNFCCLPFLFESGLPKPVGESLPRHGVRVDWCPPAHRKMQGQSFFSEHLSNVPKLSRVLAWPAFAPALREHVECLPPTNRGF